MIGAARSGARKRFVLTRDDVDMRFRQQNVNWRACVRAFRTHGRGVSGSGGNVRACNPRMKAHKGDIEVAHSSHLPPPPPTPHHRLVLTPTGIVGRSRNATPYVRAAGSSGGGGGGGGGGLRRVREGWSLRAMYPSPPSPSSSPPTFFHPYFSS